MIDDIGSVLQTFEFAQHPAEKINTLSVSKVYRGFIMTKCPFCDAELVEERREIEKGVWATVEVCPNCRDEWVDEAGHDRQPGYSSGRRSLGGSVAVRIPKEIADALSIGAGTSVNFTVRDGKMIISKI